MKRVCVVRDDGKIQYQKGKYLFDVGDMVREGRRREWSGRNYILGVGEDAVRCVCIKCFDDAYPIYIWR